MMVFSAMLSRGGSGVSIRASPDRGGAVLKTPHRALQVEGFVADRLLRLSEVPRACPCEAQSRGMDISDTGGHGRTSLFGKFDAPTYECGF